jgi:hypothetical protein
VKLFSTTLAAVTCVCASVAAADVGVMADVGAPDGATASVVYRPLRAVRLHAGVGHNLVSTGQRVGVTLVPFRSWVTPTLSIDHGRYPEGDARSLVRSVVGDGMATASLFERVGYEYTNGHVGLELGRKRATLYVHLGVSRLAGDLGGGTTAMTSDEDVTVTIGDSHVSMWTVSGRMGVILYLL